MYLRNNAITCDQNSQFNQGQSWIHTSRPEGELDSSCIFLLFQSHYFLSTPCRSVGYYIPLVHPKLQGATFPFKKKILLRGLMNDAT